MTARAAALGSLMTYSAVSFAHVDLTTPTPRAHGQGEGNLKSGPCGQDTNGRTANVTVFEPGETITVTWNEYIDHPSYFRIAFDDDGDNGFVNRSDGQTNQQADDPEAMEAALNMDADILAIVTEEDDTTSGAEIRNVQVTLPDVECESCTLQLIQYMYDNPATGYFQCADIALRGAQQVGETPDAGAGGAGGSANASDAGAAGAAGAVDTGASGAAGASAGATNSVPPAAGNGGTGGGATGVGGNTPAGGTGGVGTPPVVANEEEDDGGCTLSASTGAYGSGSSCLFSLLALALGIAARRRR